MKKDFFLPIGGGNEIGASSYLLRLDNTNILIDAGIRFQPDKTFPDFQLLNQFIGGFKELDFFLLTHAHLDHCGAITKVHYEAPLVPKFASIPTIALTRAMLKDALNVSSRRSEDWSIKDPTEEILDQVLAALRPVSPNTPFSLDPSEILVHPINAGHILGATSFIFETPQKRIMVTGDISLHNQRTIGGIDLKNISDIDVLIIESTYAYRHNFQSNTYEEEQFALVQKICNVVQEGGRVLIPAFALGRAQEIACLLGEYMEQGIIAPFPILLDGLVKPICDIYNEMRDYLQGRLKTRQNHCIYTDYVRPTTDGFIPTPKTIQALEPGCIICSSGMLIDFSRSAIYAEQFLKNPKDAIFFSGFLDDESPGKRLMALKRQKTPFIINHRTVDPVALVDQYHLSAHAPSTDLREIILRLQPEKVIFVHGNHRYASDPIFLKFLFGLETEGIQAVQAANGIPIHL